MRWLSIIILFISFASCTALKPVVATKANNNTTRRNSQPAFIENITITPSRSGANVQPAHTNNTTNHNTFSIQRNMPENYMQLQFKYAILMDVPVEALSNLKLFAFIDDWYGTPYHFGGNNKNGIDCSAFSGNLMTAVFGVGLPRMAKEQYSVCEHVKKDDLEEGDLVFFHTTRKGISHVGVYLGNNKFVHASLNYGVTISDMSDGYYARAFRGGGRARQNATTAGNAGIN
ncbi:MAG: NlpC/P60 family protein [Bacteroidota bacterium]